MKKITIKKLAVGAITATILATAAMPSFAATQMGYKNIAGNNASSYTATGDAEYQV